MKTDNENKGVLDIVEEVSAPAIYEQDGAQAVIEQINHAALSIVADATTAKGRKELKSIAYAVARSKTTLDELGKNMVAELKAQATKVDQVRRHIRSSLDATKAEVLKPVTEWENKLRAVDDHLKSILKLRDVRIGEDTKQIENRISALTDLQSKGIDPMTREAEIEEAVKTTRNILDQFLQERQKFEAEQKELARFRTEKAKRDREEAERKAKEEREAREARIAQEAAEKARKETEEKLLKNSPPPPLPSTSDDSSQQPEPDSAREKSIEISKIEDALMDEVTWLMPNQAVEIAEVIFFGRLPGVEVKR